ncbi:MAG: cadmium-translocating P-type ATPase [Saprospiraceae bacterium]|nr:cadmium-translocating P-type ATPase [Saprospiraceae bacterium]
MKTSNINVQDMLSVWSVQEVEKHICEVPGVESVTLNYDTGNATVRYDETLLNVADIKSVVRQRSHESFAQENSEDKPAEQNGEVIATPPSAEILEEKDTPEIKSPANMKNPDVNPPTGTEVNPEKAKEKSTAAKPQEENHKSEIKPTAIGEKREEVNSGIDHSKMDHSNMDHSNLPAGKAGMKDSKTDHSKMDHSKMDHGSIPMDMAGHDHHKMMIKDFKKRFWVSLILTAPILVLSPMIQDFFRYRITVPYNSYILLALSSVIYFWGGWPFLKGFWNEIKAKGPGMMTLIAMAISVSYFYSMATVFGLKGVDFFWELATLIVIMLLGHWLEMKSVLGASKALQLLVSMMPAEAHRVKKDGQIEEVKLEVLKKDDTILIKPGEKVPADGIIVEGSSYLNESMLTGESKPVKKEKENKVIGGSINGNGSLKMLVEHTGKESYLNKVITLVEEAQKAKSKMQNFSDRAAKWLTYIAMSVGFITLAVWLIVGYPFVFALERMVTVMVIACPHALGLAIPLVVAISTAVSAQNGLLIRNRTAFEESRKITALLFDKTGTLTTGVFGVTRFATVDASISKDELLRLASALEQTSEHPIAVGIINKVKELNITIPQAEKFNAITGKGVEALVEGKSVKVVSPGYLKEKNLLVVEGAFSSKAETVVFILVRDKVAGYIALADAIRPESAEAIQVFKKNGIKVLMATGDNEIVAKAVANELDLDGYYSEVLPHQKVEIVKELQSKGEFVAMTGDGVNDAPALAQSDVGIAVGSGTDVAAETADIILVNSNPKDIANLILFGKATYKKMVQNLVWATAYNSIAIPLAAGVLYKSGFVLGPSVGAVFMSLSTIIVAINAQLLKSKLRQY